MKKVLVIMGATGTGKTELAKKIYDQVPSTIISIDSVMVYKDMNIGSAKPSQYELELYPHALVDVCSPLTNFSVADCVQSVPKLIDAAHQQGRLAILVGGTMMYHYILQYGMHELPVSDLSLRSKLEQELSEVAVEEQWQMLFEQDPDYASKLSKNDQQRIRRGLEILAAGCTPTVLLSDSKDSGVMSDYNYLNIVLDCERDVLYQRLMQRFDNMLDMGFIDEVELLLNKYPGVEQGSAFRAIGYRQMSQYVLGLTTREEAVNQAKTATRRFAKRQNTWLKRWQQSAIYLHMADAGISEKTLNCLKNI